MFRSGVIAELESDISVIGQAGTVEEAIAVIGAKTPDVVLLDVHLPGGDGHGGVDVLRGSALLFEDVKILALSGSDAAVVVEAVVRAGTRWYVSKTVS